MDKQAFRNSINKITSVLDNEKIDYKMIGENALEKTFAKENQYETILKKPKKIMRQKS